jgi:hypothetical protein
VVVDHGVQVAGPYQRLAVFVACGAPALGASDVAPAAAVGHPAEFLDVHVEHITGLAVLVATDRFTGGAVDVDQAVEPPPDEDRVQGRRLHREPVGYLDRSRRCFQRRCTILRTTEAGVRLGFWCEAEDRSTIPA